jgi:hypothetical protein
MTKTVDCERKLRHSQIIDMKWLWFEVVQCTTCRIFPDQTLSNQKVRNMIIMFHVLLIFESASEIFNVSGT